MKIRPSSERGGFTLVEMMIVVAIVGLLAAIGIPNFVRARAASQKNACINNIRQIEAAKNQWGFDTSAAASAIPTSAQVTSYICRGSTSLKRIYCPQDDSRTMTTSYNIGDLNSPVLCLQDPTIHVFP